MGAPRFELRHLTKCYGPRAAVSDLSLSVSGGEIVCFLGPNGAGKSTTITMLLGLKQPTSGDILINGVSTADAAIHGERRRIGYLAEQPVLYDQLTGREYLEFVCQIHGIRLDAARLRSLLERMDLAREGDSLMRTYSMGMRKKIAFLAALVHEPDILILDEPTGALDAAAARVAKDVMIESRARGHLVFFTTHVMEIAERMADRVAIIAQGRLIADGTLADIRARHGRAGGESLEDTFLRLTSTATSESLI